MRIKFTGFVEVRDFEVKYFGLETAAENEIEDAFTDGMQDSLTLTFEKTEVPSNSTQE